MDVRRLLLGRDLQSMTSTRRLRHDLLYAVTALPFALLFGLLLNDDVTGYPLTFGASWAVLGIAMALGRYFMNRDHE